MSATQASYFKVDGPTPAPSSTPGSGAGTSRTGRVESSMTRHKTLWLAGAGLGVVGLALWQSSRDPGEQQADQTDFELDTSDTDVYNELQPELEQIADEQRASNERLDELESGPYVGPRRPHTKPPRPDDNKRPPKKHPHGKGGPKGKPPRKRPKPNSPRDLREDRRDRREDRRDRREDRRDRKHQGGKRDRREDKRDRREDRRDRREDRAERREDRRHPRLTHHHATGHDPKTPPPPPPRTPTALPPRVPVPLPPPPPPASTLPPPPSTPTPRPEKFPRPHGGWTPPVAPAQRLLGAAARKMQPKARRA